MSATVVIALIGFGVLAGAASGLLGIGGGTIMVPFLVLAIGFTQHSAEATSLLVILPTAIVGSVVLHRRGVGDLGMGLTIGVLGAGGGLIGAVVALALPATTLQLLFAFFLGTIGARMAWQALKAITRAPASGV